MFGIAILILMDKCSALISKINLSEHWRLYHKLFILMSSEGRIYLLNYFICFLSISTNKSLPSNDVTDCLLRILIERGVLAPFQYRITYPPDGDMTEYIDRRKPEFSGFFLYEKSEKNNPPGSLCGLSQDAMINLQRR